eukprot:2414303-Amphidinium_carterae.1
MSQVRTFLAWQPVTSLQDLASHVKELYEALLDLIENADGRETADEHTVFDTVADMASTMRKRRSSAHVENAPTTVPSSGNASRKSRRNKLDAYFNLKGPVKGVGDEDVLAADARSFDPVSFHPYGRLGAREDIVGDGSDIVTGHDRWLPGKLPERLFRNLARLMAVLWIVALLLSFDIAVGSVSFKTKNLPQAAAASIKA